MQVKAAVLVDAGKIEQSIQMLPRTGEKDVLVQVQVTGLCGSDMAVYLGKHAYKKPPIVLGHEFCGIVREVGPAVTSIKIGDVVCAASFSHCEQCDACASGEINLCKRKQNISHLEWSGSFADHVLVKENMAFVLSPDIDPDVGALIEPLTIGLHAMRQPRSVTGTTVVIIGAGSIGLACLLCAKKLGAARVLCVDIGDVKRALAMKLGAHQYVDAKQPGALASMVRELGEGVDITMVAASYADVFSDALRLTCPGGEVVVVAYVDPDASLDINAYLRAEIALHFSYLSTKADFNDIIAWIANGDIEPESLITHRFALDEVGVGVELKRTRPDEVGKVLFDFRTLAEPASLRDALRATRSL